ncbi:exosporium glycoprotein BclB-related protein [Lysinibacillus sp. NPDC096418]|uniref:exosporium glycoprotein BclB-related protein n=1 Tax=Lysinibacillus sp. NPDC096418 TaxID=3364138 RepID=UPI0038081422
MCSNCMNNCGGSCSSGRHNCQNLGPFTAVDVACITPPTHKAKGSIIPFSSGIVPAILTAALGATLATTSLVGFGTSFPGVSLLGNTIDLAGLLQTEVFAVPRAGNITSIAASFTVVAGLNLAAGSTVRAQIYRAPATGTVFTATNAMVDLVPTIAVPLSVNQVMSGLANVVPPVPVSAGDRLVMVFSVITPGGLTSIVSITGHASAGITID